MALIAAAPICFGQMSPSKADKSATKDAAITDSEKAAWEAYKNKQADAFKKYLATDYCGVYADGIKDVDKEVADMEKSELRDYSFGRYESRIPERRRRCYNIQGYAPRQLWRTGYIGYIQRRQRLD